MASFLWNIENLNDEPVEVSLMFTWQAGSGNSVFFLCDDHWQEIVFAASNEFVCENVSHESIDASDDGVAASGVSIKQVLREMNLEYCILGKKEVWIVANDLCIWEMIEWF